MGRDCKGCGEPVENGTYWCSDYCWRAEDGGWDDGPMDDRWIERAYEDDRCWGAATYRPVR